MPAWFDIFYLKLDVSTLVGIFFDGVTDVERLLGLDIPSL